MNLVGIANFYLQNYSEAYESFLIISEFFNENKQQLDLKTTERKIEKNKDQSFLEEDSNRAIEQ